MSFAESKSCQWLTIDEQYGTMDIVAVENFTVVEKY